ncbi:MAG: O-antigen ligase family protein [Gemmatimonadaceae bacterium]|nr:O-antigen ligase family protein [Gemmatimonadaceae bacterium]
MLIGERLRVAPTHLPLAPLAAVLLFVALASRIFELIPGARTVRPTILTVAFAIIALLAGNTLKAVGVIWREPVTKWFVAFIVGCVLTIPTSIWVSFSASKLPDLYLLTLLFFMLALTPATERAQRGVERWCMLSMALYGPLFLLFSQEGWGGGRYAVVGSSYDPNDAGTIMAVFLPLVASLCWREKGLWRVVGSVGALSALAVVGRSGSRGAAVATAAMLLTFALGYRGRKLTISLLAVSILMIGGWTVAPLAFKQRVIVTFFSDEKTYDQTEYHGRTNIWARGVRYFLQRPVTGVGLNGYGIREGQELGGRAGQWLTAHNSHLQVIVETGLVGAVPYLALLFLSWQTAGMAYRRPAVPMNRSSHRPELMASVVAFVVGGAFLSHGYSFYLYGLYAILLNQRKSWRSELAICNGVKRGKEPVSAKIGRERMRNRQGAPASLGA